MTDTRDNMDNIRRIGPEAASVEAARKAGERMGETITAALEPVIMRLVDAVAKVSAEQAELRDELLALSNRIEAVAKATRPAGGERG